MFSITAKQVDFSQTVLPLSGQQQQFTINEDGLLGKVLIGNGDKPICVPGNSALTIPG